jgi:hypothetical protein
MRRSIPRIGVAVALAMCLAAPVQANEPPPSPCDEGGAYDVWVTATVLATDTRTALCTTAEPVPSPGPAACIAGNGDICLPNFGLTIDGEDVTTLESASEPGLFCGLAPGPHTMSYCGIDCGIVALTSGTTTPVHTTIVEPHMTVRVERVLEGDPNWRGQKVAGTLTQRTGVASEQLVPSRLILEDLDAGELVELRWGTRAPRAFTWLPVGCHAAEHRPANVPGCTRCAGGSTDPGSSILVVLVVAFQRRSRAGRRTRAEIEGA